MFRLATALSITVLLCGSLASPASAQTTTIQVARRAIVMDTPRGDGIVLATVAAGTAFEVITRQGNWVQVNGPANQTAQKPWRRGWIHVSYFVASALPANSANPAARAASPRRHDGGHFRIFGEAGGTFFSSTSSFETILGSARGPTYGLGVQAVLPSGFLAQVGAERFRKTGSRAVVSSGQVFRLDVPDTFTITPIQATLGYREVTAHRLAAYLGGGAGWLAFKESSSAGTPSVSDGHMEYHLMGGVEFPIMPKLWGAVEIQWRTVPKALSGIGAFYGEDDLGGTTVVFKLLGGR